MTTELTNNSYLLNRIFLIESLKIHFGQRCKLIFLNGKKDDKEFLFPHKILIRSERGGNVGDTLIDVLKKSKFLGDLAFENKSWGKPTRRVKMTKEANEKIS